MGILEFDIYNLLQLGYNWLIMKKPVTFSEKGEPVYRVQFFVEQALYDRLLRYAALNDLKRESQAARAIFELGLKLVDLGPSPLPEAELTGLAGSYVPTELDPLDYADPAAFEAAKARWPSLPVVAR